MKVAVVGGTGVLGTQVVSTLAGRGDEVLALSRNPAALPAGAEHRRVDLTSGEGLAEALAGVEAVVDASNEGPSKAGPVLVEGTRRLLEVGKAAGVQHHVGVSIVGCDRVPIPYYKVKVEQEEAIAAGEVSWSLLRATQFPHLLDYAFGAAARFGVRPTGRALLQPVNPAAVAERLADAVHAGPTGHLPDIAGPRVQTLSELSHAWRAARGKHLLPLRIPMVGPVGKPLREGALTDPDAATGSSFEDWLTGE